MRQIKVESEKVNVIRRAIEQANYQLSGIRQGKQLRPMQYTARLCWETLYEAREILRMTQQPESERPCPPAHRAAVTLPCDELIRLSQSIEQVMGKLQTIEMAQDLEFMKGLTQQCQDQLKGFLGGALSHKAMSIVDV